MVVLSGAGGRRLGWGRWGEVPALCVGCNGAVRQVIDLQLGGGGEMRGAEGHEGGRGERGGGGAVWLHSGYFGGMMEDAVMVLTQALLHLNKCIGDSSWPPAHCVGSGPAQGRCGI